MEVLFLFILDNKIGDEGAKQISKSLETNKTLTNLYLGGTFFIHLGNNIGVEGAKQISKSLETNKTLIILGLGGTFFIHFR